MEGSSIPVTIGLPNKMFAVLQVMNHPMCNSRWPRTVAQNFTLKGHIIVYLNGGRFLFQSSLYERQESLGFCKNPRGTSRPGHLGKLFAL